MHSSFISSTNCFYLFLISLKYSLIDFMIRAITVVFISIAKCLKSSISLPPLHSGFSFIIFYHFIFFHIQRSYTRYARLYLFMSWHMGISPWRYATDMHMYIYLHLGISPSYHIEVYIIYAICLAIAMKKTSSKNVIIAQILESANGNRIRLTKIMYDVYLSHAITRDYLVLLKKRSDRISGWRKNIRDHRQRHEFLAYS